MYQKNFKPLNVSEKLQAQKRIGETTNLETYRKNYNLRNISAKLQTKKRIGETTNLETYRFVTSNNPEFS